MTDTTTELEKAEAMLANLDAALLRLKARGVELGDEMSSIALAAHTGTDDKARKRLDAINREIATHGAEVTSLMIAVDAQEKVVARAKQAEAVEVDKSQAKEVRKHLVDLLKTAEEADKAWAVVVKTSSRLRDITYALNGLGCGNPSHAQVDVLGSLAARTALGKTIWTRRFELVQPTQRTTFGQLAAGWAQAIERNIRTRLGEPPLEDAAPKETAA